MKKKEEVYVKIDSSNVAEVAKLLMGNDEKLFNSESCLAGECMGFDVIRYERDEDEWVRGFNTVGTEVSLEELTEILGVKRQFKIGDRVRIKESSKYYNDGQANPKGVDGTISEWLYDSEAAFNCRVKWENNTENSYHTEKDLELVSSSSTQEQQLTETITISRASLGRIYERVCTTWKGHIDGLINKAGNFAVDIKVPLELLRKAYSEANFGQKELLIEIAPLPKIKSTVKVSKWVNRTVYGDEFIYSSEEEAKQKSVTIDNKYLYVAVELTGEYTTEVEDPLMENIDELPF